MGHAAGGTGFEVGELVDEAAGFIGARARFAGAGLGAAAQPFDLAADFVGERFLAARLGFDEGFLLLEEIAVTAFDADDAAVVDAVDFDHAADYVVEKVAVVGDDDAGEGSLGEQLFEPEDALEIEVVGGLVEEEQVGVEDELAGDGEAAAPTAGERPGLGRALGEPSAAERERNARTEFALISGRRERMGDSLVDGLIGREVGLLRDVAGAQIAARVERAFIGLEFAGEDLEERGLTGPVGADQAEAFAFGDAEGDAAKESSGSEILGYAGTALEEGHLFVAERFHGI